MFGFRGTVLTKRSNFAADLDVWRNANRDLYFAARAVKHIRLEMAQLQKQYPGVQFGFFCTGNDPKPKKHSFWLENKLNFQMTVDVAHGNTARLKGSLHCSSPAYATSISVSKTLTMAPSMLKD